MNGDEGRSLARAARGGLFVILWDIGVTCSPYEETVSHSLV